MSRSAESAVGRIPFRIRIGVTGHRDLESSAALVDVPDRVRRLVPRSSTTSVRVGVVSALAEGADRLVVDEVFHHAAALGEQARLEVVLPFPRERYVDEQEFSQRAEDEFDKWLSRSESVMEVGATWKPEQGDRAYEAASHLVVARSDVLVALWDGKPSRGPGGTADTLLFAAELGKPCVWVPTDGVAEPYDNFKPGSATAFLADVRKRAAASDSEEGADDASERSVAATLAGAFAELDEFNRTPLPPLPHLRRRIERELGTTDAVEDWIALPFARAATLADQFQSRFMLATWLIAALATGAAAALVVGGVRRDSVDPRSQRRIPAERVDLAKDVAECILHGFLGILRIAGDPDRQAIGAVAEHGDETLGGGRLVSAQGFQEVRVTIDAGAVECRLHQCDLSFSSVNVSTSYLIARFRWSSSDGTEGKGHAKAAGPIDQPLLVSEVRTGAERAQNLSRQI